MLHTSILKESQKLISPGFIFAFTSRRDGNMSLRYANTKGALENRKNFLERLGIDYRNLICAKQVHAANIRYVNSRDLGRGALSYDTAIDSTDALITDQKNIPLAVFTADCLSILLYDTKAAAIGLVHAGWRSTKENISAKAVKFMQAKFNSRPQDLHAVFGPSIRGCCYEVREPFKDYFPRDISERSGRLYLDLAGVNKRQVLEAGVEEGSISDCVACTSCQNNKLFSFRREGESCGRMMSVAMLR